MLEIKRNNNIFLIKFFLKKNFNQNFLSKKLHIKKLIKNKFKFFKYLFNQNLACWIYGCYQVVRGFSNEVYTAIGSTSAKPRVPRKDVARLIRPIGINAVLVVLLSASKLTWTRTVSATNNINVSISDKLIITANYLCVIL